MTPAHSKAKHAGIDPGGFADRARWLASKISLKQIERLLRVSSNSDNK